MVLSNGAGRTLEESQALRDLYDRLLESLLDAFSANNRDRMLRPFLNTAEGHGLAWRFRDRVRCPVCSGGAWRYERLGSQGAASLIFCPTCRELCGDDMSGRRIVQSSRKLDTILAGALPDTTFTAASSDFPAALAKPAGKVNTTKH